MSSSYVIEQLDACLLRMEDMIDIQTAYIGDVSVKYRHDSLGLHSD